MVQPDQGLPDDGFFDTLALGPGITTGGSLGCFALSFNRLGAGAPGRRRFEIVDPDTFEVLISGTTSPVPAPPTVWLLGTGLLLVVTRRWRARVKHLLR